MANNNHEWEEELYKCPDCGGELRASNGYRDDISLKHLDCSECEFEAEEEWTHYKTTAKRRLHLEKMVMYARCDLCESKIEGEGWKDVNTEERVCDDCAGAIFRKNQVANQL